MTAASSWHPGGRAEEPSHLAFLSESLLGRWWWRRGRGRARKNLNSFIMVKLD
jgi:hypothetical protein